MQIHELHLRYSRRTARGRRLHLNTAEKAARVLRPLLEREVCEVGYVLCLTTKLRLIGCHQISRGSLEATIMHPREVFKAAVLANASGIVLGHNHPSGDPQPSADDFALTARLKRAAEVIGIDLLDHLVIGHNGRYVSLKSLGRL